MSAEHNVAVVQRAVEAIWNQGELDVADVLFAAGYVNHDGLIPNLVHGPEAIKISVVLYRLAFPDLHINVTQLSAERDVVRLRWTADRSQEAARLDSAPRAAGGTLSGRMVIRLAANQIVESWTEWDQEDVFAGLGLILS